MIYPVYTLAKRGIRVQNDQIALGKLRGSDSRMLVSDRVERGTFGKLMKRLTGGYRMRYAKTNFDGGKLSLEAVTRPEISTAKAALILIRPEDLAPTCSEAFVSLPDGAEVLRFGFEDRNETIPNYLVMIPHGSAVELSVTFGEPVLVSVPELGHVCASHHILKRERVVRIEASASGVRVKETLFRPALEPIDLPW